ncbi:MAG: ferritin-like fold-containing protein [Rhodoluna sp.]
MFEWLKRFRRVAKQLTVASRADEKTSRNTKAINLKPYTPEPKAFLGQLAYIQLANFEILTAVMKYSPNTQFKAELGEAAARSFDKYRQLSKKLVELGADPAEQMNPFRERISIFHSNTTGLDWYEVIMKVYLTSGLLDDFYSRLASGLSDELQQEVERALRDKAFEKFAKRVLSEAVESDSVLASRLALWGRRLMGDVLLELRAAFDNRKLAHVPKTRKLSVEEEQRVNLEAYSKIEPLISELTGVHSARMEALGLAA